MTVMRTENDAWVSTTEPTFPSKGEGVRAVLFRCAEMARAVPALVVSPGAGRNIEGLKWQRPRWPGKATLYWSPASTLGEASKLFVAEAQGRCGDILVEVGRR